MTPSKENKIKRAYLDGMHYKDIFSKYDINLSELKKIIHKYKLSRSKSEVLKNNQNAKNNKGGGAPKNNKNALKTGEHENIYKDVLTEEEKKIFEDYKICSKNELLIDEYIQEYKMLTIREIRMMKRIMDLEKTNKDMAIGNIKKKNGKDGIVETTTEVEPILDRIQKIEDGLTRVTEAKRKSRENMIKLGFSLRELKIKEKRAEDELW